jgi:hypothetical protein
MHSDTLMRRGHGLGLRIAFAVWASASLVPSGAHACACCTDTGQRYVATETFDDRRRDEISRLRFAPTAELRTGNADLQDLRGLRATTSSYDIEVLHRDDGVVFEFRGKDRSAGTLSLAWPDLISIFEVDPRRDTRPGGLGPQLYKEWSVTGRVVATGIFVPSNDVGTRIALILHGGGNSCGGVEDFTGWTLVIDGPNAAYSFIGELLPPR